MKYYFLIFLTMFFSNSLIANDFPLTIKLQSDGTIHSSSSTDPNKIYIITVEGTYSMWPQFEDCRGVDAAYIYEVPKEEIDNLRWPPEKIIIFGQEIEIFKLPKWVGDPKEWKIPPEEISTPLFKMSLREFKGFRIDGEPLPNTGFQPLTHRYTIEKRGTGSPFNFQILDSNRSIIEERNIGRYEDNCGELTVLITEKDNSNTGGGGGGGNDTIIRFGDLNHFNDDLGNLTIELEVGLDVKDTTKGGGYRNDLDKEKDKIIIIDNGKVICDIDSIICDKRSKPLALGLLIDNTESMQGPISMTDTTQRMRASRKALSGFVEGLLEQDETFLMSFNETTNYELAWTNDIEKLKDGIEKIESQDRLTAVFEAITVALDSLAVHPNPNKALVVLSDGGNTFPPNWEESNVLNIARQRNIPIYIVALGFTQLPIDIEGKEKLTQVAEATTKGKLFDVYNAEQLDSVYKVLIEDLTTEDDCYIYFKTKCEAGEVRWIRVIYTPNDSTVITKVMKFRCPDSTTTGGIIEFERDDKNDFEIDIIPNPTTDLSSLIFTLTKQAETSIEIFDLNGILVKTIIQGNLLPGNHYYQIDASDFNSGAYLAVVKSENTIITRKIVVIR